VAFFAVIGGFDAANTCRGHCIDIGDDLDGWAVSPEFFWNQFDPCCPGCQDDMGAFDHALCRFSVPDLDGRNS